MFHLSRSVNSIFRGDGIGLLVLSALAISGGINIWRCWVFRGDLEMINWYSGAFGVRRIQDPKQPGRGVKW